MITIICKECKQSGELARSGRCVKCENKRHTAWVNKNRDHVNSYSREWMRSRRWLNGIGDRGDIGPDIGIRTEVRENNIRVYRKRERIA